MSTAVILFLACAQPVKPSHDNHGNVQHVCSLYGQQIIPCAVNCNTANAVWSWKPAVGAGWVLAIAISNLGETSSNAIYQNLP